MPHVRVEVDSNGQHIEVDGQDVSASTRAVRIDVEAGSPPAVTVWPANTDSAVFDGDAFAKVVQDQDTFDATSTFLAAIDPQAFEQRCLSEGGYTESTVKVALRLMVEAAAERRVP